MAIHDTPENGRDVFTVETLNCIGQTVDCAKHDIWLILNGATETTLDAVMTFQGATDCNVLQMPENIGTAKAINQAWKHRQPGQHCIKMDNDVSIYYDGWVEVLEDCIERDPKIGIIGLKRKDCAEAPWQTNQFKSELKMLPSPPGHPWRVVEKVEHVMGTCQMYSSALLDKIGYLYQPGLYGFDDSLAAVRCQVAGFYSCFFPTIEINHELGKVEEGGQAYQRWKQGYAGQNMRLYNEIKDQYRSGRRPVWCDAEYQ